jgi:threonine synthase
MYISRRHSSSSSNERRQQSVQTLTLQLLPCAATATTAAATRPYKTKTIARDRLVACLLEELELKHADAVKVAFDVDCADVKWGRRVTGGATSAASEEEANVTLTMVPGPAKAKDDSSSDGRF